LIERTRSLRTHRTSKSGIRESADNVNRMFVGGTATYLDELDASHTLTANDLGLTESKITVAMSQVDLFEALGGGREAGSDMISPITSR
jgi:outer membrane protein TolC